MAELGRIVDERPQFRARVEERPKPPAKFWMPLNELPVEDRDRTHGKQADHRADLEPLRASVGQPQHVVEEPVLFIPHPLALATTEQGICDPEKMLEKLLAHVRIYRLVLREFDGDLEHVLAEERHPSRAIGLFQ